MCIFPVIGLWGAWTRSYIKFWEVFSRYELLLSKFEERRFIDITAPMLALALLGTFSEV